MTILIIEDEIPAAEQLKRFIQSYDDSIHIEGPLESNEALVEWFQSNTMPQLIFSDIELLDGPVFKSLQTLNISSAIIFTTAYDHYMLDAFQSNGIHYLLKPFDQATFNTAMEKFKTLKTSFETEQATSLIQALKLIEHDTKKNYKKILSIKIGQGIYLLNVHEIMFIETEFGLPQAVKSDHKKLTLSYTLAQLEEMLNPKHFFRINRSEIINIHCIDKVESYSKERLSISLKGHKKTLITSASRTPAFRQWLKDL